MDKITIGIIGYGFVGKAVGQFKDVFPTNIYDPYNPDYKSLKHIRNAYNSDVVFINVPTDLKNGRLDISIVESCIQDFIKENQNSSSVIVIKSTVPAGTCETLSRRYQLDNIVFNPEFLSQRTAMEDFINQQELYLAGKKENTLKVKRLYEAFFYYKENYDVEIFETQNWAEVELLKLARNTFYGLKVSYCNYLYNLCEKINIEYSTFREHFMRAKWVGEQHTMVPGPDGKFGYGGKCLPKDSIELLNFLKENDIIFNMLEQSIDFNKDQRNKGD
jgi:nucleotide sugar dehydrogenase